MRKFAGKLLVGALVGAVAGFVVMYLLDHYWNFDVKFSSMSFEWMILFMAVSILSIGFNVFSYAKMKAEAKKHVTGDEEDERDALQYKRYCDMSLAANIGFYFSIAMLALVALTVQQNVLAWLIAAMILLFISITLNYLNIELAKIIYPERDFPSVNDKQYAKKLLAMSDEGERHVMLQGMYRAYASINVLLFWAVLALIAYSIISGVSQLFAIFLIILVLIIINAQYSITIRNK